MFESDDYDQVLSQLDFPEVTEPINTKPKEPSLLNKLSNVKEKSNLIITKGSSFINNVHCNETSEISEGTTISETNIRKDKLQTVISPTHTKRKIINAHFDNANKRKFPGPAGLLTGTLEETKENSLCQMELLSQDLDSSQTHIQQGIFETPLWTRLLEDTKRFSNINTIKSIKQQALAGSLRHKKAEIVRGYVDCIDRSASDPLITLIDSTGKIQCTLHRDVWSYFASYIASKYCILVLQKPTVLTTGSAFKKHYLNITPSNIFYIYSSTLLSDEEFPDGFVKTSQDDYTIIKREQVTGLDNNLSRFEDIEADTLEGLDFSDVF